jgi:hypothetical protein
MYVDLLGEVNVTEPRLGQAILHGQMERPDRIRPAVTSGNPHQLVSQDFYHDGARYLLALNTSDAASLGVTLSGWPNPSTVQELLAGPAEESPAAEIRAGLAPLQVRVWRVRPGH